jgi:CPA1 family monovalent cation:H+ antiporter
MQFDLPTTFGLLFVVATAVAIVVRRVRLPYTVGLVSAGLLIGSLHLVNAPRLTPQFLFVLALPGLVFEAAVNLRAHDLWRNRATLALLALPGVALAIAITTALLPVALVAVRYRAPLAAGEAFMFAALISATDPVAVLALFRRLGASHRLTVLVEAESLLNDATAIAFFVAAVALTARPVPGIAVTAALAGHFVVALVGGALIGTAIGGGAALVIARIDDPMVEVTLTIIAAYGSFGTAQQLGFSGVLATVAAGLLSGHRAVRRGMSPSTRVAVDVFWEYLAFALNSIVFLLIGLEVHFGELLALWRPVVAAFLVVLLARATTVGTVMVVVSRSRERLPWRWAPVLTWGGLRGALSMVLALGLPESMPHRSVLIGITFGVVTLSIVGQGLSMPVLVRRLGLSGGASAQEAFASAREEFRAARAALEELDYLAGAGLLPARVEVMIRARYAPRLARAEARIRAAAGDGLPASGEAGGDVVRRVEHYLLDVERERLRDAVTSGALAPHDYDRLVAELDDRRSTTT